MRPQLECLGCGTRHPPLELYRCPACGGELNVVYDLEKIRANGIFACDWKKTAPALRRFRSLLPLENADDAITLGEGDTPLIRSRRLAKRLGLNHLHFKLEGSNPTGSFKDRQVSVGLSKAREFGRSRFAAVSSGNVGVALSAYAARAGAQALIWISGETALAKRRQIEVFGATLFLLPKPAQGDAGAYAAAAAGLADFCERHGMAPMTTARSVNPYMVEGAKTIAYEIAAGIGAPDILFAPAGGGGLLGGLWKGFCELRALGLVDSAPALHAAQRQAYFVPIDALDDPAFNNPRYYRPLDGEWAWRAICDSGGRLAHVTDKETRAAQGILAEEEGIFAEPHGAYAAAALIRAADKDALDARANIVCIVSGAGLKDMQAADEIVAARDRPAREVASLEASAAFLHRDFSGIEK